eukprot:m51a1_g8495 putative ubiquitin-related modifier 1 homolog (93) ;mRNA; r:29842-30348
MVKVTFSGGLELIVKSAEVAVDLGSDVPMRKLIAWIRDSHVVDRSVPFISGENVRPGILVLVNDCDWELCAGIDTVLQQNDVVSFITTLHGG